ncbi:hypothetical protein SAMN05216228_103431 [Rhizobium tibeticum]|uniref:Short chain dehydrogenase n=1 Tax=Rhizobium tibeticum TaxID=501024 RepID=A0A1H8UHH0_9HYPH|nr:short chain dehydrogenase [Rhizobium tibeticum]SEP02682.1 hypothetical protein SAMN05216228_103431 [Rhizobium tibeticum]
MKDRLGPDPEQRRLQRADVPDLTGKCFIVTGAIPALASKYRAFSAPWARVLLACHDQRKAKAATAQIGQLTPNAAHWHSCRPVKPILRAYEPQPNARSRSRTSVCHRSEVRKAHSRILGANISSSASVAQCSSFALGTRAVLRALGETTKGTGKTRQNAGLSIHGRHIQSG